MTKRSARVLGAGALAPLVAAAIVACGDLRVSLGGDGPDVSTTVDASDSPVAADAEASTDSADAGPRRCAVGAPFETTELVRGFETTDIWSARLSADETSVYLSIPAAPGTATMFDLYSAGRTSLAAPFGPPTKLSISSPNNDDYWPSVNPEGTIMFFESGARPDGAMGTSRIWFATRSTVPGNFTATIWDYFASIPEEVTEGVPYVAPNGKTLYWASIGRNDGGTIDIWAADVTKQGFVAKDFKVGISTEGENESYPVITDDDRELFFGRRGAVVPDDIYVSTREPAGSFTTAATVGGPVNTVADNEWSSWVSPDACRLYFIRKSEMLDEARLYVATRRGP